MFVVSQYSGPSLSTERADQFIYQYVDCNLASDEMDYLIIFSVIIMDAKLGQGFIMNLVVFDL